MTEHSSPIDMSLRDFLVLLTDTRSTLAREHLCEQRMAALPDDPAHAAERMILQALLDERDLDYLWLTCHRLLGNTTKAYELKDWLLKKARKSDRP